MFTKLFGFVVAAIMSMGSVLGLSHQPPQEYSQPVTPQTPPQTYEVESTGGTPGVSEGSSKTPTGAQTTLSASQTTLAQSDLEALADNTYAAGKVPLGDYKYVTTGPKKGYVYLCNVHKDNPGSMVNGPWIVGDTWNFKEKVSVQGDVSWPNATFKDTLTTTLRTLSGNGLPISHTTGTFPVGSSDPAAAYDRNPNTIKAQTLKYQLPAHPTYSDTPYCMGGEVGIMLTGVPLFNAFDAGLRDAPAHELQDSCDGHPQGSGEYHYHSLSACFKDISVKTVLGFAYDGFPITGPVVSAGKYLTTADLDECHGITSDVVLDGKTVTTYHYVMTQDFPYSVSCFRGKPVTTGPSAGAPTQAGGSAGSSGTVSSPIMSGSGTPPQPPQQAIDVCSGKSRGTSCTMQTPRGSMTGTCDTPPGLSELVCVIGL